MNVKLHGIPIVLLISQPERNSHPQNLPRASISNFLNVMWGIGSQILHRSGVSPHMQRVSPVISLYSKTSIQASSNWSPHSDQRKPTLPCRLYFQKSFRCISIYYHPAPWKYILLLLFKFVWLLFIYNLSSAMKGCTRMGLRGPIYHAGGTPH